MNRSTTDGSHFSKPVRAATLFSGALEAGEAWVFHYPCNLNG